MINILEDEEGLSIGRRKVNYIRYADDMVILKNHKTTVSKLEDSMKEYGMKIKLRKTKHMRLNENMGH